MDTPYADDILGLLERLRPGTLLAIGATATRLAEAFRQRHGEVEGRAFETLTRAGEVDGLARHDCALVTETLERLPKRDGAVLIGRLRDLYARYLVLAVRLARADDPHGWVETDLLGLGLVRLGRYRAADGEASGPPLGVYTFDLYDYKLTPDWLNSKYWANPELFDKYWW